MSGETNLQRLLASITPVLHAPVYVFATLAPGAPIPTSVEPLMTFSEREGLTLIVEAEAARRAGLAETFPCRMITLNVHSSLEAVGFLAAITARLAAAGIGVNPVSAFYHDHLFVPQQRADEALALLQETPWGNSV